jgi:type IV pilus assembly protein PilX
MQISYSHPQSKQAGIVLPIVLIFLVIMMLLGVTAIRNVTMEEKMAASGRNRHLAFQAAEMALRACETRVQTGKMNGFKLVKAGPIASGQDAGMNYWESSTQWTTVGNVVPKSAAEGTQNIFAEAPRCIIEELDDLMRRESKTTHKQYRITARGVGANTNSSVMLQSYIVLI